MEPRVPNRYHVRIMSGQDGGYTSATYLTWAFSAADVIVQFDLDQKGSSSKSVLRGIDPWREEAHGPWPEWLK